MNYRGSYRKLLGNAKAAMIGSIEIYNKPGFKYRDECFVILLLNAWELALKAVLSKKGKSILYPKRRGEPYRTVSLKDAFRQMGDLLPKALPELPIRRNLELLSTYRDNAVHFYNQSGFGAVIYALAQTSIKNFRDLLTEIFNVFLEDEISWHLLPLGIRPPIDPVAYISGSSENSGKQSNAVRQFLHELAEAAREVKEAGSDGGRLLTIFNVKLESVNKIGDADVVVGIDKGAGGSGPLTVVRTQDPNVTHPLRQKEVLEKVGMLHGRPIPSHVFQAIAWHHDLKSKPQYCWRAQEGVLTRYSNDAVAYIKRLTSTDVDQARSAYRAHLRTRHNAKNPRLISKDA